VKRLVKARIAQVRGEVGRARSRRYEMTDVPTLDIRRRAEWRAWLRENHASSPGVWLVFHKNHTGVESIPYEDAVREALCFGWIDGLIKRLDEERYARSSRRGSRGADGRTSTGGAGRRFGRPECWRRPAFRHRPPARASARPPAIPELPAYIARAFKANRKAWTFFRGCRRARDACTSDGSTRPGGRRRGSGGSASRSRCWRRASGSG
jgi:hypothetical protein